MQILFRFVIGGLVVSLFAAFGDAVKPKSFAGLFAAAPSGAMATLGLTIITEGKLFLAAEARSMIFGAIALLLYATVAIRLMMKYKLDAAAAAMSALAVWMTLSILIWRLRRHRLFLRRGRASTASSAAISSGGH
jgi:cellobiose-specific phosphotransferase system component IIC